MSENTSDGIKISYLDIKEFREQGYLQEVNRRFLHPLGLALEVVVEDDGSERLGGIWDYRHEPEGMLFAEGVIDARKASKVAAELSDKREDRIASLGYWIQPLPGDNDAE